MLSVVLICSLAPEICWRCAIVRLVYERTPSRIVACMQKLDAHQANLVVR